jgi:hypothetical protein
MNHHSTWPLLSPPPVVESGRAGGSGGLSTKRRPVQIPYRITPEINLLPAPYKWEFLRRHPEYHRWRKLANLDRRAAIDGPERKDPDWKLVALAAEIMLRIDPVGPEYPDPGLSVDALCNGDLLRHEGEENARVPIYRELVDFLLGNLSAEVRVHVGALLGGRRHGSGATDDVALRHKMLWQWQCPELDRPHDGLILVNYTAPGRGINQQVTRIVNDLKERRGIEEIRRPDPEHLTDYLRVWDAREGWCDGRYDAAAEKKLKQVAAEVGESVKTVEKRYCSAYQYVFGESYSPLRWPVWFRGKLKLSRLARLRFPKESRNSVRDVAEGRLVGPETGFLDAQAARNEVAYWELVTSLRQAIEGGRSNADIIVDFFDGIPGEWDAALNEMRQNRLADE